MAVPLIKPSTRAAQGDLSSAGWLGRADAPVVVRCARWRRLLL